MRWTCLFWIPFLLWRSAHPSFFSSTFWTLSFKHPLFPVPALIAYFHISCFHHITCSRPDCSTFSLPNSPSQPYSRPGSSPASPDLCLEGGGVLDLETGSYKLYFLLFLSYPCDPGHGPFRFKWPCMVLIFSSLLVPQSGPSNLKLK